jgi:hypothetical protein
MPLMIKLHADIFLEIEKNIEVNRVAKPTSIKNGRGSDYEWVEEANYAYKVEKIIDKSGNIIAISPVIVDFIETVNGFVTKSL